MTRQQTGGSIYAIRDPALHGEDSDLIDDRIVAYNLSRMPAEAENGRVVRWFGKKITDDAGNIIGGCVALRTVWHTAEVSLLWVDEASRAQALGSHLLAAVI